MRHICPPAMGVASLSLAPVMVSSPSAIRGPPFLPPTWQHHPLAMEVAPPGRCHRCGIAIHLQWRWHLRPLTTEVTLPSTHHEGGTSCRPAMDAPTLGTCHGSATPSPKARLPVAASLSRAVSPGGRALEDWAWPLRAPLRPRCPARTTRTGAARWSTSPSRPGTTTSTSPLVATPSPVRGGAAGELGGAGTHRGVCGEEVGYWVLVGGGACAGLVSTLLTPKPPLTPPVDGCRGHADPRGYGPGVPTGTLTPSPP